MCAEGGGGGRRYLWSTYSSNNVGNMQDNLNHQSMVRADRCIHMYIYGDRQNHSVIDRYARERERERERE